MRGLQEIKEINENPAEHYAGIAAKAMAKTLGVTPMEGKAVDGLTVDWETFEQQADDLADAEARILELEAELDLVRLQLDEANKHIEKHHREQAGNRLQERIHKIMNAK